MGTNTSMRNDLCEIHLHGRTGDGKTTVAGIISEALGASIDKHQFHPDSGSYSHTAAPRTFEVGGFAINDNPGLMDTDGVEKDEQNLVNIVNHARAREYINALVLVVNYQAQRFDSGMQDAVKLLIDSFGPKIVRNIAIVFTKTNRPNVGPQCRKRGQEIAGLIAKRANMSQNPNIRVYPIEARPEEWRGMMNDKTIEEMHAMTKQSIDDLLRWAKSTSFVPTKDADYGEYDERRRARLAEERVKEAEEELRVAKQAQAEAVAHHEKLVEEARRTNKENEMREEIREARLIADHARAEARKAQRKLERYSGFRGFFRKIIDKIDGTYYD